jgi:hypothetical protein
MTAEALRFEASRFEARREVCGAVETKVSAAVVTAEALRYVHGATGTNDDAIPEQRRDLFLTGESVGLAQHPMKEEGTADFAESADTQIPKASAATCDLCVSYSSVLLNSERSRSPQSPHHSTNDL